MRPMAGRRLHKPWEPWLYLAPALLFMLFYLLYPAVHTIVLSFMDKYSKEFVGLENYFNLFSGEDSLMILKNNLIWLIIFTLFTVVLGFIIASLVDRVRYEKIVKSIIFMPMAISFVGAGVIWKFIYAFKPAQVSQIGLLNALLVSFNIKPIAFLVTPSINNLALISVGIWVWTGFCMVVLSSALKGIPSELIEAARIDGANEWQALWYVILPLLRPVIIVVTTTMVINVLKIFDIVYVMTNGDYGTEVIATGMYKEMFLFRNFGRASALAVILLVAIIPIMIFNLKRFQQAR